MDKNAIKKFATWARRELIERVRQQAYRYGVENANADLYATAVHGVVLTPTEKTQRQALIERMKTKGYEATIEEVAYTWFDRFCALRFMEVNGYLPGRTRMFSDENGAFRPQILTNALDVQLDGLDLDTVIQLKEENKNEELFKYLLLTMCNALKPILTLFQPDDRGCHLEDRDYTWLLLPDNLLREGSVPEQMVLSIPEDDWKDAVQIVGWLYQYYNAEPKDQVFANLKKNIKISKKDIPAATQLFTPDWIVRYMVENSLGRLWVGGHPDHESLKANWKYYLEEAEQEPDVQAQLAKIREGYAALKPEDILCIDPCMGSGHILVYLFDVLVQIYEAYGYPTREAVASIVQNNLWGLDIDDRAAQLANFAVMMVARRYDKGWFRRGIQPHVMAIQESNGINREHLRYLGNSMSDIEHNNATTQMEALLDEFVDAKEYGSIIQPKEYDWEALRHFVRMIDPVGQVTLGEVGIDATQERLLQIIEQGQALEQKYHVVVTNPPYMSSSGMNAMLLKHLKKHFPNSKADLYSAFMERCVNTSKHNGYAALITMHSWMFIGSYENLRDDILKHLTFTSLLQLGIKAFDEIGNDVVQTVAFCLLNNKMTKYRGSYHKLTTHNRADKVKQFLNRSAEFQAIEESFQFVPGHPIAYWMPEGLIDAFKKAKSISAYAQAKIGVQTGNNELFIRFWPEVDIHKIHRSSFSQDNLDKWYFYTKGGSFRKWYGNNELVINWENHGEAIQKYNGFSINDDFYYQPCITWGLVSSSGANFRYVDDDLHVIGNGGPMAKAYNNDQMDFYLLALLNSSVGQYLCNLLNPTINMSTGTILSIPVLIDEENYLRIIALAKENILLAKEDYDSREMSIGFKRNPLLHINDDLEKSCDQWIELCQNRYERLKQNEEMINQLFAKLYDLTNEVEIEVAPKYVSALIPSKKDLIKDLISYAVGCMFGRYSLKKEGIIYAGGEFSFNEDTQDDSFDNDSIIPICDDEYFDDDIVKKFIKWIEITFGRESLESNLKYIAEALDIGGTSRQAIREYFNMSFYADHCGMYSVFLAGKRPIYWMFDSGKKNGFKCLVYMHRWAKDTVARVRTDYVHEMQSRYRTAIEELTRRVDSASGSERVRLQKQLTKIQGQDAELLKYEEKVHHLADQMISIDLDDGVKHNYAIFEDVLAPIK